jgi:hypothetical protein
MSMHFYAYTYSTLTAYVRTQNQQAQNMDLQLLQKSLSLDVTILRPGAIFNGGESLTLRASEGTQSASVYVNVCV